MPLPDYNYEEELAQENAKDWLSPKTVYNHLRESMRMARDMAMLGIAPSRLPIRLYPGDGIVCIADPAILIRMAEHVGYGFRIVCSPNSDAVFSDGQPCPVCSSLFACLAMRLQFRWLIPCKIYAATDDDGGWRWYKNAEFSGLRWLEMDDKLLRTFVRCDFVDEGLRLERAADWDWIVKRESRIPRWSKDEQRRLRRDLPFPGIRLPTEKMVAKAVEVAEANWHNHPEPGRAAKVLGWLPQGAVLVPCHFASKKARVFYKALWTPSEFAAYGNEKADKGNLAVRMGPADIRTTDWDNDEMFEEFLNVNPWARDASLALRQQYRCLAFQDFNITGRHHAPVYSR